MSVNLSELRELVIDREAWRAAIHGVAKSRTRPSDWTELNWMMLKLKLQYFGHLMQSWLIGKDSDAGRGWGQEEKGMTEDEMAGRHHQLDGPEFEWTLGVGDGQGGLACCNSWGCKESDMTKRLNWTELKKVGHDWETFELNVPVCSCLQIKSF